jgi:spermidine/putrescine-binding protein
VFSSRTAKFIVATVLIATVSGIAYGYWQAREQRAAMAHAPPLRVLCAENWLSEERLKHFSERNQVVLQYFTYANSSEFLRQVANSDGKVDVLCTSSFLLRSLVRSHWIKRLNYADFPNARAIAADFLHLPYDRRAEYGVPLFWNVQVFFGKSAGSVVAKQALQSHKVLVWGDELNLMDLMIHTGGVKLEERQDEESDKVLQKELTAFLHGIAGVWPPSQPIASSDELLAHADWAELPLSRVATFLKSDPNSRFVLPEDGAAFETGLLAVGEKSLQPRLAQLLINELLSSDHAREAHARLNASLVHKTLDNDESIPAWQRPRALRQIPLNRLRFPDLNIEVLPRFEKIYTGLRGGKSDSQE